MARVSQGFMDTLMVERGDPLPVVFNTQAALLLNANLGLANQTRLLWEMSVPAQTKFRWGYGTAALPMNQGYIWFQLSSAAAFNLGFVSLAVQNNPRNDTRIVKEMDQNTLHTGVPTTLVTGRSFDKNQLIALPEMGALVGQDSRMQIYFRFIANALVNINCGFSIPCTRYLV